MFGRRVKMGRSEGLTRDKGVATSGILLQRWDENGEL